MWLTLPHQTESLARASDANRGEILENTQGRGKVMKRMDVAYVHFLGMKTRRW